MRSKRLGLIGLIVVEYFLPFISWIYIRPPWVSLYLPVTGGGPLLPSAADSLPSAAGAGTVMLTLSSDRKTRCSVPRSAFHSPTILSLTLGSERGGLTRLSRL